MVEAERPPFRGDYAACCFGPQCGAVGAISAVTMSVGIGCPGNNTSGAR